MLTRLVERFDSDEFRVRQDEPQCVTNPAKYDVHAPKGQEESAQGFNPGKGARKDPHRV